MEKIYINNEDSNINPFSYLRSKYLENGLPVSIRRLDALMGGIVGYSHISELEKGKATASLKQLKAYHDFFNVSYEFLLGETEEFNYGSTGRVPLLESDIDNAIYHLSMSNKKSNRNKWNMIRMLLTTEKGQLLLFYLSELMDAPEHQKIFDKIEALLIQDDQLTYNELLFKIENEVDLYDSKRDGVSTE